MLLCCGFNVSLDIDFDLNIIDFRSSTMRQEAALSPLSEKRLKSQLHTKKDLLYDRSADVLQAMAVLSMKNADA